MASNLLAIISCDSYGHEAKVVFNGVDLAFPPGKFSASKLFTKDDGNYAQASPDAKKRNFILKEGDNNLSISYKRLPRKEFSLKIKVEAMGYPSPLFILSTGKDEGTVNAVLNVQGKGPSEGFQTIKSNG